ncbi:thiamine pyrophosphate-binding protein [Candidatus Albibeggiatoa sp. nov. BB20]|uniref:thiamine pyrophosphate-binding protein n=1 Tax=Candidatus Albibeggiatoa sp. nov. BB20 TaxID=3162723 RepID=UPI00336543A6
MSKVEEILLEGVDLETTIVLEESIPELVSSENNLVFGKPVDNDRFTFADLAVEYFHKLGVEYVFGIPGGAIAPLYDALARSHEKNDPSWPRAVVARHEAGAAFMADGYARKTGKLGICCATTGPGTTNLITGVASAYANSIPLLVITAQTSISSFGRGAFQESSPDALDTQDMLGQCTKYSSIVSHKDQFESKLIDAITVALQPPRGPVCLSVPIDIFNSSPDAIGISAVHFESRLFKKLHLIDRKAMKQLISKIGHVLKEDKELVFLVGGNCHKKAAKHLVDFVEFINNQVAEISGDNKSIKAKIVTTPEGKMRIDSNHPQYFGVFGFAGHTSAREVIHSKNVGLILAVGTTLSEWSTDGWNNILMNSKLVHIHHAPKYFTRSPMACLHVCGKLSDVFGELVNSTKPKAANEKNSLFNVFKDIQAKLEKATSDSSKSKQAKALNIIRKDRRQRGCECAPRHISIDKPDRYRRSNNPESKSQLVKPQRLMCELVRRFPENTHYLADTGNSFAWSTHYLFPKKPRRYSLAMGLGSMGWAIGSAVGIALATKGKKNSPVVCITGDGSYLMSGQEITVAVAEQLPVVFVILNDSALGMVMHGQRLTGAKEIGYELPPVDYAMMAHAVGAVGYTVNTVHDIEMLDFNEIANRKGPTLLDIKIDREEVPPMGMRVNTLIP